MIRSEKDGKRTHVITGHKRIALIKDGVVDNVILASDNYTPPPDYIAVDADNSDCGPGWTYQDNQLIPPPPKSVPEKQPTDLEITIRAIEQRLKITDTEKEAAALALKNKDISK